MVAIFLCDFIMFTTQRCVNLFGPGHEEKSVLYAKPAISIIQLCLEMTLCLSIFIAIFKGQS